MLHVSGHRHGISWSFAAATLAMTLMWSVAADAAPTTPELLAGQVLDDAGVPIPGATVYVTSDPQLQKTTDDDGRFRFTADETAALYGKAEADTLRGGVELVAAKPGYGVEWVPLRRWGTPSDDDLDATSAAGIELRLPPEIPIRGRIVNEAGDPVPGVEVELGQVVVMHDLPEWLEMWENSRREYWPALVARGAERRYTPLRRRGWPAEEHPAIPEPLLTTLAVADEQGRFTLRGIGRDRVVWLEAKSREFGSAIFLIAGHEEVTVTPENPRLSPLHAAAFTQTLQPAKPLRGIVREHSTGKPLDGVSIAAINGLPAMTDTDGRFAIHGLAKQDSYHLIFNAAEREPHLRRVVEVGDTPGFAPIEVEVELFPGVPVTGTVVDSETGQPLPRASLNYTGMPGNLHVRRSAFGQPPGALWYGHLADKRGQFQLNLPPGLGLLGVAQWYGGEKPFAESRPEDFRHFEETIDRADLPRLARFIAEQHAVVELDLSEEMPPPPLHIQLHPADDD